MYTFLDDFKLAKSELIIIDKVKVTQLCLTLCDPTDYTVRGILQARILEWVAISYSKGSSWPRDQNRLSSFVEGFLTTVAQLIKNPPAMRKTWVQSLGWEDPLEKEMATHSSIAWKIQQTKEPGRLQSMGWQRVGQDWATSLKNILWKKIYHRVNLNNVDYLLILAIISLLLKI